MLSWQRGFGLVGRAFKNCRCFSLSKNYKEDPKCQGLSFRNEERVADQIEKIKSDYSNLGDSIVSLADRLIFRVDCHPLNTITNL